MSLSLSDRSLAQRYARAFFGLLGRDRAPRAGDELSAAARDLAGKTASLRDPRLSLGGKKERLRAALRQPASEEALRFLDLLVEEKRLELLEAIAEGFSRLCDEDRGIVQAAVRSASELGPEEAAVLKARLARFFGKEVVLHVRVDPELIAGAEVRVGDWVLDASFQGELGRLRELLSN